MTSEARWDSRGPCGPGSKTGAPLLSLPSTRFAHIHNPNVFPSVYQTASILLHFFLASRAPPGFHS